MQRFVCTWVCVQIYHNMLIMVFGDKYPDVKGVYNKQSQLPGGAGGNLLQ